MARTLTFTIEGEIDTIVFVEEGDFDGDGKTDLRFTVTVDESDGTTADLRGLFWDDDNDDVAGWSVYAPSSPDITDSIFETNGVKDLGNGANMNGKITSKGKLFDAGVEIGTQGIGQNDIQSTTFVIKSDGVDLTLDDIGGQRFGVRLTSVGEIDGDRGGSLKVAGTAPNAPDAIDDEYTDCEDTCITGNVLANDTDDDGDVLTVVEVNGVAADVGNPVTLTNGVLTLDANGSFTFVPTTSFIGTQTFEYSISDGDGGFDWAEVTINLDEKPGIVVDLDDNLAIDPDSLTLSTDDGEVANITRGADGTVTFELSVFVPDLPEVADIVLAQDLSGSFSDDLSMLQSGNFVADLLADLSAGGADDVGFGIASYIDYPFIPFGRSGDFIYATNQAITTNAGTADAALDALTTGNGGDGPEAQLVALQQVALRADGEIGFRADAQRFVVLSTDANYHLAGDYVAGGANDNDTDLGDGTGTGGVEDYPSVAQLAAVLVAADLTPIFTVTSGLVATYDSLLTQLNTINASIGGSVQTLSSDSSNLSAAIIAGLEEATTDVDLNVSSDDFGFITGYTPTSFNDVDGPETVTFEVTIEAPTDYADDVVTLSVPGFGSVDLNFSFGDEDIDGTEGRDTLSGNGNANTIDGKERADVIDGEGGDDILIGGLGNDTVTGGSGADTFVLEDADKFRGTDTFTDFEDGIDSIQLSGFGGLGFGDLVITETSLGSGDAEISVGDGKADDPIAIVEGAFGLLDSSDFVFV